MKFKDLNYKNIIFCIRENNKWVAGIFNGRRTQEAVSDKQREVALMKLAYELLIKLEIK